MIADDSLRNRVLWGVRWGLGIAAVLAAWATGVFMFGGGIAFEQRGVSIVRVVLAYFAGGVVGGSAIGAALPFAKHGVVAAVLGAVTVAPIGAVVFGSLEWPWTSFHTVVLTLFCLILGVPAGLIWRRIFWADLNPARPRRK